MKMSQMQLKTVRMIVHRMPQTGRKDHVMPVDSDLNPGGSQQERMTDGQNRRLTKEGQQREDRVNRFGG